MLTDKALAKRGDTTRNRLARKFRDWTFTDAHYVIDGGSVRLFFRCSSKQIVSPPMWASDDVREAIDALEAWALEAE